MGNMCHSCGEELPIDHACKMRIEDDNGEAEGPLAVLQLIDSPYVIRTIERADSNSDGKIAPGTISSRFVNFRKYLGVNFLNPTLVFQSGMIDKCLSKEREIGELKSMDYQQVYKDLGLDSRPWQVLRARFENFKKTLASSN